MIKNIHSIDRNGKVNFTDSKGEPTDGTKDDCLSYGFKFRGNRCFCYETKTKPINDKNFSRGNFIRSINGYALGVGNKIKSGINNIAIGFSNLTQKNANYSLAIGRNSYAENYGEIAFSASLLPNRAKFSFYQFDGFTTNNLPTEIYLGGVEGQRFFINEDYETAFAIDYSAVALNANSNDIFTNYGHATYKYTNRTLSEVGHDKSTTIRDASTNHYDIDFAPISGTPDYIELKVTGDTGHDVYWTVDLKVTEVRNG
tara:strand:- start:69 stop:839 length:771 start_codon:yes stop_codon:yes gene_type:complete